MSEVFSAEFDNDGDTIKVFSVHHASGDRVYLGTLDLARECDYEGKYVFCLDAGRIIRRNSDLLHIPTNVLREIANYGLRPNDRPIVFYIDALGAQPYDKRSSFAWLRTDNGHHRIGRVPSLTHVQAHCSALLEILNELRAGSRAVIYTSSRGFADEFSGRVSGHIRESNKMIRAAAIIVRKDLKVAMRWIAKEENRATDLLDVYLS